MFVASAADISADLRLRVSVSRVGVDDALYGRHQADVVRPSGSLADSSSEIPSATVASRATCGAGERFPESRPCPDRSGLRCQQLDRPLTLVQVRQQHVELGCQ